MGRGVEVEWQLVCRDVAALERWLARARFDDRWGLTRLGVRRLADAYYDTADGRIARAGFALRVRRDGGKAEATLKALRRAEGGVARRREITSRLASARIASLHASTGVVGVRVRRMVGDRPLRRLFAVRTRRVVFALRRDGRVVAEVALDRTELRAPDVPLRRLERLEVEARAGRTARVAAFVAALRRRRRLVPAARSKFEEGLRAARRSCHARLPAHLTGLAPGSGAAADLRPRARPRSADTASARGFRPAGPRGSSARTSASRRGTSRRRSRRASRREPGRARARPRR
ncbi:MAG: CYTH domain-containing protein [Deltaproteobacteria bacterium]|nr:CYTH domain-containing protein [Deltaproteobacteria bacterium]